MFGIDDRCLRERRELLKVDVICKRLCDEGKVCGGQPVGCASVEDGREPIRRCQEMTNQRRWFINQMTRFQLPKSKRPSLQSFALRYVRVVGVGWRVLNIGLLKPVDE